MFIIASVRLYVWISCCKDSLRSAEGRSMHFLYYSYCANEQPPGGTWKIPQSFFFSTFTWSNEQCMRSLFILMLLFNIDVLCFLPEERWRRRTVVFWCLSTPETVCVCVCVQILLGGILAPQLSWNSHRRDRQYKMSGKKQTHTWIWGRPGASRACFGLDTYKKNSKNKICCLLPNDLNLNKSKHQVTLTITIPVYWFPRTVIFCTSLFPFFLSFFLSLVLFGLVYSGCR